MRRLLMLAALALALGAGLLISGGANAMSLPGAAALPATADNAGALEQAQYWYRPYRRYYRPFGYYYRPYAHRPFYYRPYAYQPYPCCYSYGSYQPYGWYRPYGGYYGYRPYWGWRGW